MMEAWSNAGWNSARVHDLGTLRGGGTPSRKRAEYFAGALPWLTGQDVPDGISLGVATGRECITQDAIHSSTTQLVPAGSVLVTTRVTVGKTAVALKPLCFSQDVTAVVLQNDSVINPYFVAYYLYAQRERLLRMNQGSTITGITRASLGAVCIPLPPLSEQRRIVEILQEAEQLRRLRAQAEGKTAQLIPTIFDQLFLRGGQREHIALSKLADVVSGVALGRKIRGSGRRNVAYIRVANVQAGFLDLTEIKETLASDEEIAAFRLEAGDVLLTEGGDFDKLGRGCLWEGEVDPCIHQNHVFRVRALPGALNPVFFAHYLQSAAAKYYFLRCAKRTTNLASINLTQLKSLPVPRVFLAAQEQFAALVRVFRDCSVSDSSNLEFSLTRSLFFADSGWNGNQFSGSERARSSVAGRNEIALLWGG